MRRLATVVFSAALAATTLTTTANALEPVNSTALEAQASPVRILGHLRYLQAIANRNDGNRAAGTRGYTGSVNYVRNVMTKAGFDVSLDPFTFDLFSETAKPLMVRTAPVRNVYREGTEFATMEYSGSGNVLGALALADGIMVPPGEEANSSASGCLPDDFGPETAGKIALIQRGTCSFADKVNNAAAAGAIAAIIFNEGQPGRRSVVNGTLGGPVAIPAVGTTYGVGRLLVTQVQKGTPIRMRLKISTEVETVESVNVLAEKRGGATPGRVVVVGGHLDSVAEGPGINDNGSGIAMMLATAVGMDRLGIKTRNTLRFAFWGAEESGLIGSTAYVTELSERERSKIMANLNFDMIGSPNYARFVYDGDGTLGQSGPPGSDTIERVFEQYFADKGLASEPTDFDGRSDYLAFIEAGIPAGGLFSGAEVVKTPDQVKLYGGEAGKAFDPCYHAACDDIGNVNRKALKELGGAAVNAILTLAQSKDDIREPDEAAAARATAAFTADYRGHLLVR